MNMNEMTESMLAIPRDGSELVAVSHPRESCDVSQNVYYSSVLGHRMWGTILRFGANPKSDIRREMQASLVSSVWTDEHSALVRASGWTHIIFDKNLPFPRKGPFWIIHDSESFLVVDVTSLLAPTPL